MEVAAGTEPRRLHLGCGRTILPGWTNLDLRAAEGVDVVADLDQCGDIPLPFPDDTFDEFRASHLFEHLRNPLPFMEELHRIAKAGATAEFRVPYGSSDDAYEDPTHVRQCFLGTFLYFSQPAYWRADYGYRGDWDVKRIRLLVSKKRYEFQPVDKVMHDVTHLRNVVKEMIVEMVAIKPIRPHARELQVMPPVELMLTDP